MQNEQFLKAAQPVPEHLRGTRQGLFHMLNAVVDKPSHPALSARPEPVRLANTPKLTAPENGVQTILQSDDFIFSD